MKQVCTATVLLLLAGCSSSSDTANLQSQAPPVSSPPDVSRPKDVATPQAVQSQPQPLASIAPTPSQTVDARFQKQQEIVLRELAKLQTASPERDLQIAWQNKDSRFIAVRTIATQVFGVKGDIANPIVDKYKVIEGTGDYVFSAEQEQLQRLATQYATRYNSLLMKRLLKDGQESRE